MQISLRQTILFCLLIFTPGGIQRIAAADPDSIEVYVFLSETCPICKSSTLSLRDLYKEFKDAGISFKGVFPNLTMSTESSLEQFGRKYKLDFPLFLDLDQELTRLYGATHTPQVYVVRKADNTVLYKGKIDNGYEALGKKRQVITEHYLRKALQQILAHTPVEPAETKALGCFIIQ